MVNVTPWGSCSTPSPTKETLEAVISAQDAVKEADYQMATKVKVVYFCAALEAFSFIWQIILRCSFVNKGNRTNVTRLNTIHQQKNCVRC